MYQDFMIFFIIIMMFSYTLFQEITTLASITGIVMTKKNMK